jgi:hypothetical protein
MARGDIRLSPRHGVNPSVGVCFLCGEDDGTVVLPGMMKGDKEAPRRAVWTREPCPKCKDWQKQGVILISVSDAKTTDKDDPYRTGGWVVIKDEAVERWPIDDAMRIGMLKHRMAWIEDEVWEMLGLPALEDGS